MDILHHSIRYSHSIKILPGGEVRYGCRPVLPPKRSSRSADRRELLNPYDKLAVTFEQFWFLRLIYFVSIDGLFPGVFVSDDTFLPGIASHKSPLGSRSEFHFYTSSHSKAGKPGYGLPASFHPFSQYAKNSIKWRCSAIEERFGVQNCHFITATLPGSTWEAIDAFACWSGWFLDTLNQWLKRNFSIDGQCYRVSVWEYQKRGALHLHMLVAHPDGVRLQQSFPIHWNHLLEKLSDDIGVDLFARQSGGSWRGRFDEISSHCAKVIPVERSCSQYLAKYLSKSHGSEAFADFLPPPRWWSCSRAARDLADSATQLIDLPMTDAPTADLVQDFWSEFFATMARYSHKSFRHLKSAVGELPQYVYRGAIAWFDGSFSDAIASAIEVVTGICQSLSAASAEFSAQFHRSIWRYIRNQSDEQSEVAAWEAVYRASYSGSYSKILCSKALHRLRSFLSPDPACEGLQP